VKIIISNPLYKIKSGNLNNPIKNMKLSLQVILSSAKDLVSKAKSRFFLSGGQTEAISSFHLSQEIASQTLNMRHLWII